MKTVDNKYLPLKITHELVHNPNWTDEELRAAVGKHLQYLAERGFGGVVFKL